LGRGPEGDEVGNLPGVGRSAERDAGTCGPAGVLVGLTGHRGRDLAGGDGVGGDAMLAQLQSHRLDQPTQAVLGRVVGAGAHPRLVLVHEKWSVVPRAGVVDEHVAAAEVLDQGVDGVCAAVEVSRR